MKIRLATIEDSAWIAQIYAPYVTDSAVSFEAEPPDSAEIEERMMVGPGLYPWLAAEGEERGLAGYAYAAPFRSRHAYRFVVETSVYLRPEAQGRGIGRLLYAPLLGLLEAQGYTQAIAAIALPNDASVRLHEQLGFRHAGTYAQVGYKLGRWWDVSLWQRPLALAVDDQPEIISFHWAERPAEISRVG